MPDVTIGILGGGQLAALLASEAIRSGVRIRALENDPDCPAAQAGAEIVQGSRHDEQAIRELARTVDVLTVDIEDVNVDALVTLAAEGHQVIPAPATLQRLTNKLAQKQRMQEAGIPTSTFVPFDGQDQTAFQAFADNHDFPVVQKTATGGYDGRGVAILRSASDWDDRLQAPGFLEKFIKDATELSVMVARTPDGQALAYEPVDMAFNQEGNLLDFLCAPARIDKPLQDAARQLGLDTIAAFDGVGIFGVEMFLTPAGELMVNEIAPRTHNSGHYTIDACTTSQFRAQLLILTGQPLEPIDQQTPAVMFNLLGAAGYTGDTIVEGLDAYTGNPAIHPYLYGKKQCFPLRKMGHVTVTAPTIAEAIALADEARTRIVVRGAARST